MRRELAAVALLATTAGARIARSDDGTPPGAEPRRPHASTSPWLYTDALVGAGVAHGSGEYAAAASAAGLFELLFGPRAWSGRRLPLRLGPWFTLGARRVDGEARFEAAGGVSALVGTGRPRVNALDLSAGAVHDVGVDDGTGVVARVATGMTTTGPLRWKPISLWLFAEVDVFPAGDRTEVLLGLRIEPMTMPFMLVSDLD